MTPLELARLRADNLAESVSATGERFVQADACCGFSLVGALVDGRGNFEFALKHGSEVFKIKTLINERFVHTDQPECPDYG